MHDIFYALIRKSILFQLLLIRLTFMTIENLQEIGEFTSNFSKICLQIRHKQDQQIDILSLSYITEENGLRTFKINHNSLLRYFSFLDV